ncbi:MAG: reverse transcriptase domain-containing protein [Patescibacteria group bacterium]
MGRQGDFINHAADIDTLRRAWRWIKSNPDARYKKFFSESYSAYSLIEDEVLLDLSRQLKQRIYEPCHSCKIYIPKASGILRPYSLLTVEDQIIYQAFVNIIAEKLHPKVASDYYVSNFGHLYAQKSSIWFYRKWSDGYRKFNEAARDAFNNGLKYSASFDLTACYDSLDHGVLRYFLKDIGLNDEFIDLLTHCLSRWTGNEATRIYHNHGIPQGPLSSGLLSEVVLRYFDKKYPRQSKMRYMRYVDDIRLYASSTTELRKMLIRFDRMSKEIGLFPQSSKIEIHEIKNIDEELKSVSNPTEVTIKARRIDQNKIQKRLIELTKRFKIHDATRFKYILAHAIPSAKLNGRLWKLFKLYPAYYESITRYYQRYKKLPKKLADSILKEIQQSPIYSSVTASLVTTIWNRASISQEARLRRIFKAVWSPRVLVTEAELNATLGFAMTNLGYLTPNQLAYALKTREWYVRVRITQAINQNKYAHDFVEKVLNEKMRDKSNEVACLAALVSIEQNISLVGSAREINIRAAQILKRAGKIGRMPRGFCWSSIDRYFSRWLDNQAGGVNWKNIFVARYGHAEHLALNCMRYAGLNVNSWIMAMDVFNDLLLDCLYQHDSSIGKYELGKIGSVLMSTGRFAKKYPTLYTMIKNVHDKRLECELAHAVVKSTGRPTGSIKFRYFSHEAKPLIKRAFQELATLW